MPSICEKLLATRQARFQPSGSMSKTHLFLIAFFPSGRETRSKTLRSLSVLSSFKQHCLHSSLSFPGKCRMSQYVHSLIWDGSGSSISPLMVLPFKVGGLLLAAASKSCRDYLLLPQVADPELALIQEHSG